MAHDSIKLENMTMQIENTSLLHQAAIIVPILCLWFS